MSSTKLLPSRIRLVGWVEHYDLRTLRRNAVAVAAEHKLAVGDALLVSGSWHHGGRRFAFLVATRGGPMVLVPQTGDRDMLLSLTLRVAGAARQVFGDSDE